MSDSLVTVEINPHGYWLWIHDMGLPGALVRDSQHVDEAAEALTEHAPTSAALGPYLPSKNDTELMSEKINPSITMCSRGSVNNSRRIATENMSATSGAGSYPSYARRIRVSLFWAWSTGREHSESASGTSKGQTSRMIVVVMEVIDGL